jgi:hypothetical protein
MPKSLNDKIYSDRSLTCVCGRHIADVRFDGQCLVIGSLVFFNAIFWRCLACNRASSYIAPVLPNEPETLDNQVPDTQQLQRRAAKIAKITKTAQKRPDYGLRKSGDKLAVVVNGDYLGLYEPDEAVKVRDAALAEDVGDNFDYQAENDNPDYQSQNQTAAT